MRNIPPPLDPKDYLKIWFWTAKSFKAYQNNQKGETDGLATQPKRRSWHQRDENNKDCHPYLKNTDGTPVPSDVIAKIGQKARRVWHTLHATSLAPPSWGKANKTAHSYYISKMLNVPEFKSLRYCEGNWKIEWWTTKSYPSFVQNYLQSNDTNDTNEELVNKRKRDPLNDPSLLQIDNNKNKGNVIDQIPEPTPTQNASSFEAAPTLPESAPTQNASSFEATPKLSKLTSVPTQVSSHQISRPLLTTLNISNPQWCLWIPCTWSIHFSTNFTDFSYRDELYSMLTSPRLRKQRL